MKTLILSFSFLLLSNLAGAQTAPATHNGSEWIFNTAAVFECETRQELITVLRAITTAIQQGADGPALESFLNLAELHAETLAK